MDNAMTGVPVVNSYLVGMSVLLFVVLIGLLTYIFWAREKEKYWNRYRRKFRDSFMPMIFTFLEEDKDPDFIISRLTRRTQDLRFFLELLDELEEVIRGGDREKLSLLIHHELFYSFYKKNIFSIFRRDKIIACIYFEHLDTIDDRVKARLVKISQSHDIILSFAATKALQASENITIRKNALIRFLSKEETSELMIYELLHFFYREQSDSRQTIAKAFFDLLNQKKISPDKKGIIVLYIAQQGYYEYGEFLHGYLEKIQLIERKKPFIIGIVKALGQLQVTDASPLIREVCNRADGDLQKVCVEALGMLGGKDNLSFLINRLLQVPVATRKSIIRALVRYPTLGHKLVYEFLTTQLKFIRQFKAEKHPPKELKEVIQKIHNTAMGIRIMLPRE